GATYGERSIADRAEAEVIDAAGSHGRHVENVGAWRIVVRIRAVIFEVIVPINKRVRILRISRRRRVAQIHDNITKSLGEREAEGAGSIGRELQAVVAPITGGECLVGESRAIWQEVRDCPGGNLQTIADV